MRNVYFFGLGYCAKYFINKVKIALKELGDFQVLGILDNNVNKVGTIFEGYKVYSPDILKEVSCDLVLIFLMKEYSYKLVFQQLSNLIPKECIHEFTFPMKLLLEKRYKNSTDAEIQETLEYISNHKVTVFNQFIKADDTYDEVKWDPHIGLPYVDFRTVEGKKVPMYYPSHYDFIERDGMRYVKNLLWEQSEGSPHLYIKPNHGIKDGDCIVDAGVCEGNFALKYVDVASHIYLFEMDPVWQEPLKYTFQNYENKVTIINKMLSDKTTNKMCRIDDIITSQKVDFIKMDIEGAELSAIHGAERIFRRNNIKSSICSYHRNGDERAIRTQLETYGYQTTVSEGYMLFLHDDETWKKADLRRGIVYGER